MAASGAVDSWARKRHYSEVHSEPMSSTMLPWDKFSNWLHCVCVVTFDLELGQALELLFPSHAKLTEKEKMNICYLSFPDSNSGCMGDTQFCFRIRQCSARKTSVVGVSLFDNYGPPTLQRDSGYLYGFVYFRQVKDKSLRRGYFQKSVVLISKLPYTSLFSTVSNIIAPEYFDKGAPSLEAACHDIDQWPCPEPGDTLQLPLMGGVIQVRLPSRFDKPGALTRQSTGSFTENILQKGIVVPTHLQILSAVNDVDLFGCLQPVLPHIQLLWELILIGEPIVVMAPTPETTSSTVLSLVSMISPLRYANDFRPYFTIHDSEFREYTTRTQAPPPVILGVTNPFFAKTLQHWPHIVRIGEMPIYNKAIARLVKPKKATVKALDSKPGLYTMYKPYLQNDKDFMKRVLKGVQSKRPVEVQSALLRRHFLELTQSFIIPLERYVASLMPLQRNISPWKHPPRLRQFEAEEFLKTLVHSGPQLTSGLRGDWVGLYRKFFQCHNFHSWLQARHCEINEKLQVLHLEALVNTNILDYVKDKEEVEIVDIVLKLREKIKNVLTYHLPVKSELIDQLTQSSNQIIATLPEDLQTVLYSNS